MYRPPGCRWQPTKYMKLIDKYMKLRLLRFFRSPPKGHSRGVRCGHSTAEVSSRVRAARPTPQRRTRRRTELGRQRVPEEATGPVQTQDPVLDAPSKGAVEEPVADPVSCTGTVPVPVPESRPPAVLENALDARAHLRRVRRGTPGASEQTEILIRRDRTRRESESIRFPSRFLQGFLQGSCKVSFKVP